MQLNLEDLARQAQGFPHMDKMLAQAQAMMAGASVAAGATAKHTVAGDAANACKVMNQLFKDGHIPMGAPVPDEGRFIIFYWHKEKKG